MLVVIGKPVVKYSVVVACFLVFSVATLFYLGAMVSDVPGRSTRGGYEQDLLSRSSEALSASRRPAALNIEYVSCPDSRKTKMIMTAEYVPAAEAQALEQAAEFWRAEGTNLRGVQSDGGGVQARTDGFHLSANRGVPAGIALRGEEEECRS